MAPMTASFDPNTDPELRDAAIAWLVRVQSDAATGEDWRALTDWLDASPSHLAAFEAAEQMSAEIEALGVAVGLDETPPQRGANIVSLAAKRRAPFRWPAIGSIAAALVVAIASPALWTSSHGAVSVYATEPGGPRSIRLADGTQVRMDGSTRIMAQQGWFERHITMGDGQASFDVAKDRRRPFIISVGDQQVRVVGTEFNIRHANGAVDVVVRRGIVEVWPTAEGRAMAVRLVKGQALHQTEGAVQSSPTAVDPDAAFGWSQGRLIYNDQRLTDVVADLNRQFMMPIKLAPSAANVRFSGVLLIDNEESVLRRLAAYTRLTVRRQDAIFVLG